VAILRILSEKSLPPGIARWNRERVLALLRSILYIDILGKGRIYHWKLFWWSLLRRPKMFPMAITYSIYGYHFRKVYRIAS